MEGLLLQACATELEDSNAFYREADYTFSCDLMNTHDTTVLWYLP